jgi:hypothetical protein
MVIFRNTTNTLHPSIAYKKKGEIINYSDKSYNFIIFLPGGLWENP